MADPLCSRSVVGHHVDIQKHELNLSIELGEPIHVMMLHPNHSSAETVLDVARAKRECAHLLSNSKIR